MRNVPRTPVSAPRSYTVKALVKAFNILEVLSDGEEATYTLTQLSRRSEERR